MVSKNVNKFLDFSVIRNIIVVDNRPSIQLEGWRDYVGFAWGGNSVSNFDEYKFQTFPLLLGYNLKTVV